MLKPVEVSSNKELFLSFFGYLIDMIAPMFTDHVQNVSYFFHQSILEIIKFSTEEFKGNLIIMEMKNRNREENPWDVF